MNKSILTTALEWLKKLFVRKKKGYSDEIKADPIFIKTKRVGKGAAFKNNRKRTRGRKIQYISDKVIKHDQSK